VNVGSTAVGGSVVVVTGNSKDMITFDLFDPVCTEIGEKIAISRRIEDSWR
jgi:translation initiation factor 2 gamma subunit (eIF-2gamma)